MISDVNPIFLDSGGLKDLSGARPGAGYTGHSFNDFNHCDLTTMLGKPDVQHKTLCMEVVNSNFLQSNLLTY